MKSALFLFATRMFLLAVLISVPAGTWNTANAGLVCDCSCGTVLSDGEACDTLCHSMCDSGSMWSGACECCCNDGEGWAPNWASEDCDVYCPTFCSDGWSGGDVCSGSSGPDPVFPTDPNDPYVEEFFYPSGQLMSRNTYYYREVDGVFMYTLGEVTVWHENGAKSAEYQFNAEGHKHGPYYAWNEDGKIIAQKNYEDDVPHGSWVEYYDDGETKKTEGVYVDGVKEGIWKKWREDGSPHEELMLTGGIRHGLQKYWLGHNGIPVEQEYDAGEIRSETWYGSDGHKALSYVYDHVTPGYEYETRYHPDGETRKAYYPKYENNLHGAVQTWHENGNPESETHYQFGNRHGSMKEWYEDNTLKTDTAYEDDRLHGTYRSYNEKGGLTAEGEYQGGLREGVWKYYFTNGRREWIYENGLRKGDCKEYVNNLIRLDEVYVNDLRHGLSTEYAHTEGTSHEAFKQVWKYDKRHGLYEEWHDPGAPYPKTEGEYGNGARCGLWTYHYIDENVELQVNTTDYGTCPAIEPVFVSKPEDGNVNLLVYDTVAGDPVSGADVTLLDVNKKTGSDGKCRFDIRDIPSSALLEVSAEGYQPHSETLNFSSKKSHYIRAPMYRQTGMPIVRRVDYSGKLFFHQGGNAYHEYTVHVDWNGQAAGSVKALVNGVAHSAALQADGTYKVSLNMGSSEFNADTGTGKTNTVTFVAENNFGEKSTPYNIHPLVLAVPEWMKNLYPEAGSPLFAYRDEGKHKYYIRDGKYPKKPLKLKISEETIGTGLWEMWKFVPVVGGNEIGIDDTQIWTTTKVSSLTGAGEVRCGDQLNATLGLNVKVVGVQLTYTSKYEGVSQFHYASEKGMVWDGMEITFFVRVLSNASAGLRDLVPSVKKAEKISKLGIGKIVKKFLDIASVTASQNSKADFKLNLVSDADGNTDFEKGSGKFIMTQKMGLDVGIDGLLKQSFFGYGSTKYEFEIPSSTFITDVGTKLGAGVSLQIWTWAETYQCNFQFTLEDGFTHACPDKELTNGNVGFRSEKTGETELATVSRSFLDRPVYNRFVPGAGRSSRSGGGDETLLVENIYPYSSISQALENGKRMIVYVYFNPALPTVQATELYYMYDGGTGFNAPLPVTLNTRGDYNPRIAFTSDEKIVAVWEQVDEDGLTDTDIEASASRMEIVYAVFDPSAGTWSAPAALSANAFLDHSPMLIRGNQGELMVIWRSNALNLIYNDDSGMDVLQYSVWNGSGFGAPSVIGSTFSNTWDFSADWSGSEGTLVYVKDTDGDWTTGEDRDLFYHTYAEGAWSAAAQIPTAGVADAGPRVVYTPSGTRELIWKQGDDLVRKTGGWSQGSYEIVREESGDAAFGDVILLSDSQGQPAVIWQSVADGGADLFYASRDAANNVWSGDIRLTESAEFERYTSAGFAADGTLYLAYTLQEEITDPDADFSVSPQNDLYVLEYSRFRNLTVAETAVVSGPEPPAKGNVLTIGCTVENSGNMTESGLTVSFYEGDPDAGGVLLGQSQVSGASGNIIPAGKTGRADFSWTVPDRAVPEIFARVDAGRLITETDETDNTGSFYPVRPDADLSIEILSVPGTTEYDIIMTVYNNSQVNLEGMELDVSVNGYSLALKNVPPLLPGAFADVVHPVFLTDLVAYGTEPEISVRLKPGEAVSEISTTFISVQFSEKEVPEHLKTVLYILRMMTGETMQTELEGIAPLHGDKIGLEEAIYYLQLAADAL